MAFFNLGCNPSEIVSAIGKSGRRGDKGFGGIKEFMGDEKTVFVGYSVCSFVFM